MPPGSPPECITGDINDSSHPALDGLVISQKITTSYNPMKLSHFQGEGNDIGFLSSRSPFKLRKCQFS